jgi:putative PIN family toxin of toxin-antitoxin system
MKADRLVIDSNVWIAALLAPKGTARRVINAVLERELTVLMSEATFTELVERLQRPKFDRYRDSQAWDLFPSELVELASWHEDSESATGVCRDVDDDKFLSLAVTGEADVLITGDGDLLELGSYSGIPVMPPAQFLQYLDQP